MTRRALWIQSDTERRWLRGQLEARRGGKRIPAEIKSAIKRWIAELEDSARAAPADSDTPSSTPAIGIVNLDGSEHRSTIVDRIFRHWSTTMRRPRARLDARRRRLIETRLRDGYSEAELIAAIDGCRASDFHQGDNDRGRRYDSIELILRGAREIEQFIDIAEQASARPGQRRPSRQAVDLFLQGEDDAAE